MTLLKNFTDLPIGNFSSQRFYQTLLIYQSVLFPVKGFTKQVSMYFLWLKSFTITFHYGINRL